MILYMTARCGGLGRGAWGWNRSLTYSEPYAEHTLSSSAATCLQYVGELAEHALSTSFFQTQGLVVINDLCASPPSCGHRPSMC